MFAILAGLPLGRGVLNDTILEGPTTLLNRGVASNDGVVVIIGVLAVVAGKNDSFYVKHLYILHTYTKY